MRVDAMLSGNSIGELAAEARGREAAGYDGLWSFEAAHDPFLAKLQPWFGPQTSRRTEVGRYWLCWRPNQMT